MPPTEQSGDLPAAQRPLAAFFQSAAPHGGLQFHRNRLSDASKTIGSLLMFISACLDRRRHQGEHNGNHRCGRHL